jgi:hypothetical protein
VPCAIRSGATPSPSRALYLCYNGPAAGGHDRYNPFHCLYFAEMVALSVSLMQCFSNCGTRTVALCPIASENSDESVCETVMQ